ncbi:hypothetical protein SBA5_690022 [Candidatus Sulfotelmatomonas gaucii]|uniref:Uncharacterized protein n=1 Tax=Candidatus Sulfuritelmatomonas gaucii TaxID=2043161 RepID=A0A2N9LZW2_9BACT|nr:hypothetical protein SBA5_690022 [Candidatus Sulfotelmatomonas gaucii]
MKTIARELVDTVRRNTTIDWTVRAHLCVLVKRISESTGTRLTSRRRRHCAGTGRGTVGRIGNGLSSAQPAVPRFPDAG